MNNGFADTDMDYRMGFSALDQKLTVEDVPFDNDIPSVEYEVPVDKPMELPRRNEEHCNTREYSYVYGIGRSNGAEWTDQLVKAAVSSGETKVWREKGCYPGGPILAPEPGKDGEDAGLVLSVVSDVRKSSSFLLVLDAEPFGKRARAGFPNQVPSGFHGGYFGDRV